MKRMGKVSDLIFKCDAMRMNDFLSTLHVISAIYCLLIVIILVWRKITKSPQFGTTDKKFPPLLKMFDYW